MPTIPQIVAIPQMRAPEAAHLSEYSPTGAALQQAGETVSGIGEQEARIAQVQQHTQDALQLHKGVIAGQQLVANAHEKIAGLPADQMLPAYQASVDTSPILSDPQFARVKDELALHLQTVNADGLRTATQKALIAKHSELKGQLDTQLSTASQQAANATSALAYNTAVVGGHASIDAVASALTAQERADRHLRFDHTVAVQQAETMAADPTHAAQMLMDGGKSLPGADKLLPEDHHRVQILAAATLDAPVKAVNLNHAIVQANHTRQLDEMAANGDPHLHAAVLDGYMNGWVSADRYKQYLHERPPLDPREKAQDDPVMVAALRDKVLNHPFDVDHVDIMPSASVGAPGVTPRTAMQLRAMLTDARGKLKGPIGEAYSAGQDQIQNSISPPGYVPPSPDEKRSLQYAMRAYNREFSSGEFHTPSDAHKRADELIKKYKPPPIVVPPPPPTPPAPPSYWARAVKYFAGKSTAGAATTSYEPGDEGGSSD